jgi:hypothetical protein
MGDRGNIGIKQRDGSTIYFYTHWQGYRLEEILREALLRGRDRWSDSPYLARIIFSELVREELLSTIGYGISNEVGDNEHPILIVDVAHQSINVLDSDTGITSRAYSFTDFLSTAPQEACT